MKKLPKAVRFLFVFLGSYFMLLLLAMAFNIRDILAIPFANWASEKYRHAIPHTEAYIHPHNEIGRYDILIAMISLEQKEKALAAKRAGQGNGEVETFSYYYSLWYTYIISLVVLISLFIASPFSWKRKIIALVLSLVVLSFFNLYKFKYALIYSAQQTSSDFAATVQSSFYNKYIDFMLSMNDGEFVYISTFLIWAVFVVRVKDVKRLLHGQ